MSTRYSVKEVQSIVSQIEVEAKMIGLIGHDCVLTYGPGNSSMGISGMVECYQIIRTENGRSHREHVRVDFLPVFNWKQTKTEHAKLLEAALNVFFALRRQREQAETARRRELSEHVARRSGT